ncbi:MAG: N-6 DNA methylase [Chloroflexi bacterium]|nr:N-6 DNA methylase [Chloroflexota bacterium]
MGAPDSIYQLVEKFDRDKPGSETEVRIQFVDPLFSALGWDLQDKRQVRHEPRVIIREAGIERSKRPDYSFHTGNSADFFVEAKMPHVNLERNPIAAFQLRRYGWSGNAPVSVLTDFEEFSVYDCRIQPQRNDLASKARLRYFQYGDLLAQWDWLATRFSREAVASGALREWVEGERVRGFSSVDQAFLREMETWRELLAKDIALHNRELSQRQLNLIVQRAIDRIVFLRIAEDRNIEAYGRLRSAAAEGKQVYAELKALFNLADDKYNSGLFHFGKDERASQPDTLSLHIHIPDEPLRHIITNLYFPFSPYEFSVLPADILGQVYERFLGKVIELGAGGAVRIEAKPEVRKAGGVYYTPTYIVDYIVENTVGALVEGKTPRQVDDLRILDPACGSGSFLVGAYQYLLDWHLAYYRAHPKRYRNRRRETADGMALSTAEKRRILQNNIYGVDLDQNAVEVSKLSLLLKMLEQENDAAGRQTLMFAAGGRILPDLSGNIKWGNSLIGSDFFRGAQAGLFDDEEAMLRVKAFDWDSEDGFGAIMAAGGFDAVIGNPPYVRQETLGRDFKNYAKGKFESYVGTADLYIYFIEQSHRLLKQDGRYGVICSNKFLRTNYGKGIRNFLSTKSAFEYLIDFGELPVFADAATFPLIMITTNGLNAGKDFIFAAIKSLNFTDLKDEVQRIKLLLDKRSITGSRWTLASKDVQVALEKIKAAGIRLKDYIDTSIYFGIKTGLNAAFVIDRNTRDSLVEECPRFADLIHPFASGDDIRKYKVHYKERYLITIPKGWTNRQAGLTANEDEAWNWLTTEYPPLTTHLKPFKARAQTRYDKGDYWWELRACDYYDEFAKPKIIYPDIAKESRIAFDTTGLLVTNTVWLLPSEDKYLLGILNSSLIFNYYKYFASVLGDANRGGRLRWFRQDVLNLPIRTIDFDNPADVAMHDKIVDLVDEMLERHKQLPGLTGEGRKMAERLIATVDGEIDALVYRLYGLSEDEVAIVEG